MMRCRQVTWENSHQCHQWFPWKNDTSRFDCPNNTAGHAKVLLFPLGITVLVHKKEPGIRYHGKYHLLWYEPYYLIQLSCKEKLDVMTLDNQEWSKWLTYFDSFYGIFHLKKPSFRRESVNSSNRIIHASVKIISLPNVTNLYKS